MTETNWQGQVLQRYLPSYLSEEVKINISKDFIDWHDANKTNDRLKDALNRVRLKINKKNKKDLINHILAVCFFASRKGAYDGSKIMRDGMILLNKNIEKQRAPLNKLRELLEQCIDNPVKGLFTGPVPDDTPASILDPEQRRAPFPPEYIKGVLDHYSRFVSDAFGRQLKEANNNIPLHFKKNIGVLCYPEIPPKQAYRENPHYNCLSYNLAFLFRHFTQEKEGDWLPSTKGPMPIEGNSYYELIGELANATFYPEGNEVDDEDQEFHYRKIEDRVLRLTKAKVQLGTWFGGMFGDM